MWLARRQAACESDSGAIYRMRYGLGQVSRALVSRLVSTEVQVFRLEMRAESPREGGFCAQYARDANDRLQPLISVPEAITDSRVSQANDWLGGVNGLLSTEANLRKPQIVNAIAETRNTGGRGNTVNAAYAAGYLPE